MTMISKLSHRTSGPLVGSQCSHLVHSVGDMKLIETQYKLKIQTGKVSPYTEWNKSQKERKKKAAGRLVSIPLCPQMAGAAATKGQLNVYRTGLFIEYTPHVADKRREYIKVD